jgi:hypothetical protein
MSARPSLLRLATFVALVIAAAAEGGWKWDHFIH